MCVNDTNHLGGWRVVQKNPSQVGCDFCSYNLIVFFQVKHVHKSTSPFDKQTHRIAFRWTGAGTPTDLIEYEIVLEGAEGNPHFNLEILTDDMHSKFLSITNYINN